MNSLDNVPCYHAVMDAVDARREREEYERELAAEAEADEREAEAKKRIRAELAAGETAQYWIDIYEQIDPDDLQSLVRIICACPNDDESIVRAARVLIDTPIDRIAAWERRGL